MYFTKEKVFFQEVAADRKQVLGKRKSDQNRKLDSKGNQVNT